MRAYSQLFAQALGLRGPQSTENTTSEGGPGAKPGHIYWAMRHLPREAGRTHLMVTGSTGSGKTTLLRLLMQSIVPMITPGSNMRALIYDPKRDMVPIIHGMEPKCPVTILNPFDRRTHAWHLSADVRTPQHANAVASLLIPEERGSSQPFFANAARSLLASVMAAFALRTPGRRWTLRDVILAMRSPERLRAVTKLHPSTYDRARVYLEDSKPLMSILTTAATRLDQLEIVAALWAKVPETRSFSLSEWLSQESLLILGTSPANRVSLEPINLALFRRLTDLLLDQQDDASRYTWLVLDELREAGRLDLSSICNQGRSKGACAVMGFQDIEGFQEVYGEKVANELCGQCAHSAYLRTNSHKTAEWVEHHFGEALMLEPERSVSSTSGPDGGSTTTSTAYRKTARKAVLASEILGLHPTGPKTGLTGFYDIPGQAIERRHTPWHTIQNMLCAPSSNPDHEAVQNWDLSNPEEEILKPWDERDYERLGIKREPAPKDNSNPLLSIVSSPPPMPLPRSIKLPF